MRLHEITDLDWTRADLREALGRSMARVHSHVQNWSIGLISANLETNTPEENTQARHELTKAAKQMGFGYSHVRGMAKERDRVVSEPSLMIIGHQGDDPALKSFVVRAGRRFNQSSVIYKSGESNDATQIFTRDGEEQPIGAEKNLGPWHANRTAAQFFTGLKSGGHFDFGGNLEEMQVIYLRPISFSNRQESLF